MGTREYVMPQISVLEFEVEKGYANSIENWDEGGL